MSADPMKTLWALLLASSWCLVSAPSGATSKSRIAVVGDLDALYVGQDGYCGSRTFIEANARMGIFVAGDQRTWLRMGATFHTSNARANCTGEFSFLPRAGHAYVVRYSWPGDRCLFELFRVVPGADPVTETLTREEPQACIAQ